MSETAAPIRVVETVRWGDMDAFAHVNNTVFFRFFESARIAYFEAVRLTAHCPEGVGPILASTTCDFLKPLTFPDRVIVTARCVRLGAKSFTHAYEIESDRLGLAGKGQGVIVMFDYPRERAVLLPEALRAAILAQDGDDALACSNAGG